MKKLNAIFPELYFIVVSFLITAEHYLSTDKINYFAILTGWLMFLQLFYKHRLLGIIYGSATSFASLYVLISLIADYDAASSLVPQLIATVFSVTGLIMGIAMTYKFAKSTSKYDESVLTVSF